MDDDPVAAFRAEPQASAVFLDIDGTLAPIVAHPDEARVPDDVLDLLRGILGRYRLVAAVSGRAVAEARRLLPLEGLLLAGNHGFELDVGSGPELAPEVEPWLPATEAVAIALGPIVAGVGGWIERKGPTLTVHVRQAPDPDAAAAAVFEAAVPIADLHGFILREARRAIEFRPPLRIDKGTSVQALLRLRPCARSLYCGDDVTDLDAFAVVDLAVAVRSDEAPAQLVGRADLTVDDVRELLDQL